MYACITFTLHLSLNNVCCHDILKCSYTWVWFKLFLFNSKSLFLHNLCVSAYIYIVLFLNKHAIVSLIL